MTIKTLEKANEIRDRFNAIVDLETLFRNASMEGAEIRACRSENGRILNRCKLELEIAEKLIETLHTEAARLNAELEAL